MQRIANTHTPELDLNQTYRQVHHDIKPNGLWYSIDEAWPEWCEGNMPGWTYKHQIELILNPSKLLIIQTPAEADAFTEKFNVELDPDFYITSIKWEEVIKQYAGIEIQNYHQIRYRNDFNIGMPELYLSAWDVSSGCIWDLSIINSYTLL